MSEAPALFSVLRQSAEAGCVAVIERLIADAPDHHLSRINALAFARRHGLDEEKTIAAFLHAARIGLFELSWNVLCPGCGGVLDANATLKSVRADEYNCALCAAGYEPTAYAYPFGEHSDAMDQALIPYVDKLRVSPGGCPW